MTKPLSPPGRVAVIGAGAFGRFSTQAYLATQDLHVVAVADPEASARALLPKSGIRLEADWQAVVADRAIECVHVATPPFARGEVIEAAFAAGKSVFCEKPLALNLSEADHMIAASRRAGVALGVDYVMRFQPAYRFISNLAASGLLGRARSFSFQNFAQHVPPTHWFWKRECSGGILVEHGVHFFDVYGGLVGRPLRVAGRDASPHSTDVTVWYEGLPPNKASPGSGTEVVGRYYHEFAFPKELEYAGGVIMFERGNVAIEGWIPTRLSGRFEEDPSRLHTAARASDVALNVNPEGPVSKFEATFPDRDALYARAIVDGMRDLLRKHRDPRYLLTVTAEDARHSLVLALAARAASDSGEVVELLPLDVS